MMDRLLVGAIALTIALTALFYWQTRAHAGEQTRFYDSRGNSIGTATRDSNGTTVFRESRGRTIGRSSK